MALGGEPRPKEEEEEMDLELAELAGSAYWDYLCKFPYLSEKILECLIMLAE